MNPSQSIFRWLPILLVIPTFVWIAFAVFRSRRFIDRTGRPRTDLSKEEEEERRRNGASLAAGAQKLRWLNLILWLTVVGGAIAVGAYNSWLRK